MSRGHVDFSKWIGLFTILHFSYLCELKCKNSFELGLHQHAAEDQFMHYLSSTLRK